MHLRPGLGKDANSRLLYAADFLRRVLSLWCLCPDPYRLLIDVIETPEDGAAIDAFVLAAVHVRRNTSRTGNMRVFL